jgi:peroxiredoxin
VRLIHLLAIFALCALAIYAQAPQGPQGPINSTSTLKVGDQAPDFTLPATIGGKVKLSDFKGKKNVVLAFFPGAFTAGCTKEMTAYQLDLAKFEGNEVQVFGVSTDNTPSQAAFGEKLGVTFPMLSDFVDRKVSMAYGVFNPERAMDTRVTFVIDKTGKIAYMEQGKVDTLGAGEACSRLAHKTGSN